MELDWIGNIPPIKMTLCNLISAFPFGYLKSIVSEPTKTSCTSTGLMNGLINFSSYFKKII